jgi:hypothetical protein
MGFARFGFEALHVKRVARGYAILFSTGFNDGIHSRFPKGTVIKPKSQGGVNHLFPIFTALLPP